MPTFVFVAFKCPGCLVFLFSYLFYTLYNPFLGSLKIYNVVVVSSIQQSNSILHTYMNIFFFRFFSIRGKEYITGY